MSDSPSISDILAEFQADFVAEYATLSMLALAVYEYVITLDHEYRFLFQYKWSSATLLFLGNRYLMLVAAMIPALPMSSQACYNISIERLFSALGLLPSAVSAVFSALRVYALLDRGYATAAVVFLLSIVPVVTNIYGDQNLTYMFVDDSMFGASCEFESFVGPSVNLYLSYATRLSLVVADLIVVFVTWYKTFQDAKRASSLGFRGLSTVMLQDGSMYFIVLLLLNILQLLLDVVPSFGALAPVSNLNQVVPSVLISRFLIHLRQSTTSSKDESTHIGTVSAPNFRGPTATRERTIGPMGEYLDYADDQDIRSYSAGSDEDSNDEADSAIGSASEFQTPRTAIIYSSIEEVNRDVLYAGETYASRDV